MVTTGLQKNAEEPRFAYRLTSVPCLMDLSAQHGIRVFGEVSVSSSDSSDRCDLLLREYFQEPSGTALRRVL